MREPRVTTVFFSYKFPYDDVIFYSLQRALTVFIIYSTLTILGNRRELVAPNWAVHRKSYHFAVPPTRDWIHNKRKRSFVYQFAMLK
jgi:hypothetical protein